MAFYFAFITEIAKINMNDRKWGSPPKQLKLLAVTLFKLAKVGYSFLFAD